MNSTDILQWQAPVQAILDLARRAYSGDFTEIAVREAAGQNSPDARATRVDVEIRDNLIAQVDDGDGMTPEILQNAFFTLGGSHKPDGSTGGFGYAKFAILDGNAGPEWELWTRPRGSELTYYVSAATLGRGPIKVLTEAEGGRSKHGTAIFTYRNDWIRTGTARQVLQLTDKPGCAFYLNGEEIEPIRRLTLKAEMGLGQLYFKRTVPDELKGYLVVRMRGSYQFKRHVSARMDGMAVLELTPRDVRCPIYPLTPNREQLRAGFTAELDQVLEGLQTAEKLRDDPVEYTVVKYRGKRDLEAPGASQGQSAPESHASTYPTPIPTPAMTVETAERLIAALETFSAARQAQGIAASLDNAAERCVGERDESLPWSVRLPDMIVRRHRKARRSLNPLAPRNLRLQRAWYLVLQTVCRLLKIEQGNMGVGWIVDQNATILAERFSPNGREYMLLSPVLLPADTLGLTAALVQRAVHELTHRTNGWHDSSFASSLHAGLEACNPHLRGFHKLVRAAMRP